MAGGADGVIQPTMGVMKMRGVIETINMDERGNSRVTVIVKACEGGFQGPDVVILTTAADLIDRRIVLRARREYIRKDDGGANRGPFYRCHSCSWTWDADAIERHAGGCIFAPVGVAAGHIYEPGPDEP